MPTCIQNTLHIQHNMQGHYITIARVPVFIDNEGNVKVFTEQMELTFEQSTPQPIILCRSSFDTTSDTTSNTDTTTSNNLLTNDVVATDNANLVRIMSATQNKHATLRNRITEQISNAFTRKK